MTVVVDATMVMAQILPDAQSPQLGDLVVLSNVVLIAPAHLVSETVHGVLMAVKLRRISSYAATGRLQALRHLDIDVERALAWDEISPLLELSTAKNLSVSAAGYLYLAIEQAATLGSLDNELRSAAVAMGVPVWPPA